MARASHTPARAGPRTLAVDDADKPWLKAIGPFAGAVLALRRLGGDVDVTEGGTIQGRLPTVEPIGLKDVCPRTIKALACKAAQRWTFERRPRSKRLSLCPSVGK